ncbi:C40 family peptidase [Gimesia sp.]|uniref:C40 family peptidase n=1 Tax=Gimesia sp. TaxID=2024833 RepID=UPI003A95AE0C
MDEKTKQDFIEHAKAEYPKECCGLLIQQGEKQLYMPCRNIALQPENDFSIHPSDVVLCEELGEIVGICHSHPDASSRPSNTDKAKAHSLRSEYRQAIWYIFSWPEGDLYDFDPRREIPLIGRQFVHGTWDCYGLIRDYFQQELQIDIPDFERDDGWWETDRELYLDNFDSAGFSEVCPGMPELLANFDFQIGDIILMQIRSQRVNHAAVYIGQGQILHHMYGKLSKRDVYGGFWLRCSRCVVRHRQRIA